MEEFEEIPNPVALYKRVEERIRQAIVTGRMNTNTIYTETSIAKQMNVSRTPVREAILDLASRGFVTILPRRGFQVTMFSEKEIREVYDLRWAIESFAVRTIAEDPARYDLTALVAAARDQKEKAEKQEIGGAVASGRDFHHQLLRQIDNSMIDRIFADIQAIINVTWIQAFTHSISAVDVAGDHLQLVHRIEQGDADAACLLLREHLDRSKAAVLQAQVSAG
ncbi:MAG: GntR family transcriptional regulator [Planctomycetes bacterium]|nr:GntR family transcriptional regulator [Planctomycetota bacterium]